MVVFRTGWLLFASYILIISVQSSTQVKTSEADYHDLEAELPARPEKFDTSFLPNGPKGTYIHPVGEIDLPSDSVPPCRPSETGVVFYVSEGYNSPWVPIPYEVNNCSTSDRTLRALMCQDFEYDLEKIFAHIKYERGVKFIVGGYLDIAPKVWQKQIAKRLHQLSDAVVIIVGWNKANQWDYNLTVASTKIVARQITMFLYYLAGVFGHKITDDFFYNKIEFVGHSLGAHIAGFVGKDLGGKLGRIVGLDPAGPSFSDKPAQHRLDRSDAQLVEVVHTNADYAYTIYMGIKRHVGHVDYYPNGGTWQPGCSMLSFFKSHHEIVREFYIASLDHNLALKSMSPEDRKRFQFLAFRSDRQASYTKYSTGRNFHQLCGAVTAHSLKRLNSMRSLDLCSVPVDFTKPLAERLAELERRGIDLSPNGDTISDYYFYTQPESPYLDSHFVLQLSLKISEKRLLERSSSGSFSGTRSRLVRSKPKFDASIRFDRSDHETIPMDIPEYELIEENDRYRIILPFVSLNTKTIYSLINLEARGFFRDHPADISSYSLGDLFPESIMIILKAKTLSLDTKVSELIELLPAWLQVTKLDRSKSDVSPRNCIAYLESVRIEPLIKLKQPIGAIYSTDPTYMEQPNYSFLSPDIQMSNSIPRHDPDSCLVEDRGLRIKLYLHSIVVGPPVKEDK